MTRHHLERHIGMEDFLKESIHAKHTAKKRAQHLANLAARSVNGGKRK